MDNLPVVIKKDRGQLESLATPGCRQRMLCPHGKLLAILNAEEVIKIHVFCSTSTQCTIDSDRYKKLVLIIITITNNNLEHIHNKWSLDSSCCNIA